MGRVGLIKAVFLDRDGVLNSYLPQRYVENPDQLIVLPGVDTAIRQLNDLGILAIVISNQQAVARDIMTQGDLDVVTEALENRLTHQAGARLDAIYYCTHSAADDCMCRKPKPGMILAALKRFNLDPHDTMFVGDTEKDLSAALAANVGIKSLVLSGSISVFDRTMLNVQPDLIFSDLPAVVRWILDHRN